MERSGLKNHIRTSFGGTHGVYVESLVARVFAATGEPVIDNPDDWKAEFNLTPDFIVGDPDDGEAIVEVFDRTAGLNFGENHLVPEEGTEVLTLDTHIAAHDLLEELRIKVERYSPIGLPMIIAVAVSGEAHRHDIFLKQALYGEHWVNDLADNMWSELHEYGFWNSTSGPMPGSENVIGLLIIRDAFFAHTPTLQFHAASSHECPPYGLNWKEPASIGGLVHDTWLGTPCSVDVKTVIQFQNGSATARPGTRSNAASSRIVDILPKFVAAVEPE